MDLRPLKSDESLMRQAVEQAAGAPVRWMGATHRQCRCVFHSPDRHPSAGIHRTKDGAAFLYTCCSCGFTGDLFRVISASRGVSDADVIRHLHETGELLGGIRPGVMRPGRKPAGPKPTPYATLSAESVRWRAAATLDWLAETAAAVSSAPAVLAAFGWGHRDEMAGRHDDESGKWVPEPIDCQTIPMWDRFESSDGPRLCGVRLRWPDGTKRSRTGSAPGLFAPDAPPDGARVLWVCEGATDPAALASLGLWSVGLPAARQGIDLLDAYVARHKPVAVVAVADNNPAGKASATLVARAILGTDLAAVKTILPPDGAKDVRAWIQSRRATGHADEMTLRLLKRTVAAARPHTAERKVVAK